MNDRELSLGSVCLRVLGGYSIEELGRRCLAPCSRRATPPLLPAHQPGAGALSSSARRPSTQIIVDTPASSTPTSRQVLRDLEVGYVRLHRQRLCGSVIPAIGLHGGNVTRSATVIACTR